MTDQERILRIELALECEFNTDRSEELLREKQEILDRQ